MNDELKNEFGKRLIFVRKNLNITQKDFAKSLGISACNLSSIESGKSNPTVKLLKKISFHHNVRMDYLFRGTGDMFLDGKEENNSDQRTSIKGIDSIDDIVWLAERSTMFRNTILGYAATYYHNNEINIERNIEIKKSNSEANDE